MLTNPEAPNLIAGRVLTNLKRHYEAERIEEIVVNRPGEVWIKKSGGEWYAQPDPDLTYEYFSNYLCPVLANINSARFNERDIPIVACELPGQPYRFQCVVGNNVRYAHGDRKGIALSIRSLVKGDDITFENYGLEHGVVIRGTHEVFEDFKFDNDTDDIDLILSAVKQSLSILVSGPTSSGKTTFINQVIKAIDHKHRIISVEDARELTLEQPNHVNFVVPRHNSSNQVGYNEIIDCLMRLTPDYVICGEVSVSNAGALYNLMGKGHPIMSTVHAGSPQEAMQAFANNMMSHGSSQDAQHIIDGLSREVGCIIQLTKQRRISDIVFPALENHKRALAQSSL